MPCLKIYGCCVRHTTVESSGNAFGCVPLWGWMNSWTEIGVWTCGRLLLLLSGILKSSSCERSSLRLRRDGGGGQFILGISRLLNPLDSGETGVVGYGDSMWSSIAIADASLAFAVSSSEELLGDLYRVFFLEVKMVENLNGWCAWPKTTQPLASSLSGGLPCPIVLYES